MRIFTSSESASDDFNNNCIPLFAPVDCNGQDIEVQIKPDYSIDTLVSYSYYASTGLHGHSIGGTTATNTAGVSGNSGSTSAGLNVSGLYAEGN
jgi:hypothetical protein